MMSNNGGFTERQRQFIRHYLRCNNGADAARRAGYSDSCAKEQASRLLAKPAIREEVDRRQAARAKRLNISADTVIEQLLEDHDAAADDGQHGAAVRATELLGRHLGMFTDRVAVEDEREEVDVAKLLRELRENQAQIDELYGPDDPGQAN